MTDVLLPSYARLRNTLNQSNIQSWNPAVYQVLNQLIDLGTQDQQAMQDIITTEIDNSIKIFGSTIPTSAFNVTRLTVPISVLLNAKTTPLELVPAPGPKFVIIPIYATFNTYINNTVSTPGAHQIFWGNQIGGGGTPDTGNTVMNSAVQLYPPGAIANRFVRADCIGFTAADLIHTTSSGNNKSLLLTNTVVSTGGGANGTCDIEVGWVKSYQPRVWAQSVLGTNYVNPSNSYPNVLGFPVTLNFQHNAAALNTIYDQQGTENKFLPYGTAIVFSVSLGP